MLPIEIGIPQGTILGPLLLIIYENDIFDIVESQSYIFSYADDTLLICYDVLWVLVAKRWQNLLCKVKLWLQNNVFFLNISKTMSITFEIYADSLPLSLEMVLDNEARRNNHGSAFQLWFWTWKQKQKDLNIQL